MSELVEELKAKFDQIKCKLNRNDSKAYTEQFSIETFPHCHLEDNSKLKKCSLLILLFKSKSITNDELAVLLTVRNFKLRKFPGGRFDSSFDSSFQDTALREAYEEIGLKPDCVQILTEFCPVISPLGDYIVPIVALIENKEYDDVAPILNQLKRNEDEVESIFWLPLRYFSDLLSLKDVCGQLITPLEIVRLPESVNNTKRTKFSKDQVVRTFVQLDEKCFENVLPSSDNIVIPKNMYVYGVNAHIMIYVCLTLIENSKHSCQVYGTIDTSNILEYFHFMTLSSYLLFRQFDAQKNDTEKAKL